MAMMCTAWSGLVVMSTADVVILISVRMAVAKVCGSSLLVIFPHARIPRN